MTDIIKLAREAGIIIEHPKDVDAVSYSELERFAELVAAPLKAENVNQQEEIKLLNIRLNSAHDQINGLHAMHQSAKLAFEQVCIERDSCKADANRWRYSVAIGGNQTMNWLDVYDDWDGDGDFTDQIDAARAKEQT